MAKTNAEYCKEYRDRKRKAGLCIFGCGNKATQASGLCEGCHWDNQDRAYARHKPKFQRTGRHIGGKWIRESARQLT
jgi:hypothetical protein